MQEDKTKRRFLFIAGPVTLFLILIGVTYAFFNYTRTGSANNIRTGRIYFNSTQSNTLNITNTFPMTSAEAGNSELDAVTIGIVGDTTYVDGEEYEITLVGLSNTINNKEIPINYIATYTPTTGNTIGTSSNDYWNAREDKDASIYLLNATGEVEAGKQVLVGYVDNEGNGINGTLTIKAYIDADRIAISDTYPEETVITVKTTGYSSSSCEIILDGVTNASTHCASASSLQEAIDNEDLTSAQVTLLVNAGLVEEYTNGTTSEWVAGRTVLTTEEWNSLSSNPISFKIRAESNEGIWVEEPLSEGAIRSCPQCKYLYVANTFMFLPDNVSHQAVTELDPNDLSSSYLNVISSSNKNYFLGVKLDENNRVTNAYACGVKNNVPFCIEGTTYNNPTVASKYASNVTVLQQVDLWNNSCSIDVNNVDVNVITCGLFDNSEVVSASASEDGAAVVGYTNQSQCSVLPDGYIYCN